MVSIASDPTSILEECVGHIHERRGGDKTHFCVSCSLPIAVYGRLQPCLHAFCLSCASDMDGCFLWVLVQNTACSGPPHAMYGPFPLPV